MALLADRSNAAFLKNRNQDIIKVHEIATIITETSEPKSNAFAQKRPAKQILSSGFTRQASSTRCFDRFVAQPLMFLFGGF